MFQIEENLSSFQYNLLRLHDFSDWRTLNSVLSSMFWTQCLLWTPAFKQVRRKIYAWLKHNDNQIYTLTYSKVIWLPCDRNQALVKGHFVWGIIYEKPPPTWFFYHFEVVVVIAVVCVCVCVWIYGDSWMTDCRLLFHANKKMQMKSVYFYLTYALLRRHFRKSTRCTPTRHCADAC